ncbi:MAG: D-glycero-beta-D-manno-heptose 1,7-bisphosphate 7-phosphatase [Bacteroidota bacterium]
MKRVALFLDRDGTINEEREFISSPEQVQLIPRSAEAIRDANAAGIKVFVITNQSGIARGFLTEQQLAELHRRLLELLQRERAHIDGIYYCPHYPELGSDGYGGGCECRKPKPGLLQRAAKEFDVDLARSYLVGDRLIDIQTGKAAGTTNVLVLTGYGRREYEASGVNDPAIDYVARDLYDAWQYIKQRIQEQRREHQDLDSAV